MSLTTAHGTGAIPAVPAALAVAHLSVTRRSAGRDRITVLDGVSLAVAPGECLAIVGASGAGKSVLARTLLGLTDPTDGAQPGWRVTARNFEVAGVDVRRARRSTWRALRGSEVALVLQDALQSLDPLRTIEAEVSETLAIQGVQRRHRRGRAIRALTAAGLPDAHALLPQRSTALSGGMRQRALIAAALAGEPSVLIADEPTTALDPATARHVLDEFARVRDSGTALIVVSHDLGAVARIANRVMVLENGRVVESGSTAQLLSRPSHPATQALVDAMPSRRGPLAPPREGTNGPTGAPLVTLAGVTRSFGNRNGRFAGIRDVHLTVRRGEVLGVAGGSGEGKTTLARVIAAAESPSLGTVEVAPGTRIRLIPQDPLSTFDPRWRVRRVLTETLRRADFTAGTAPTPTALLRRVGLHPKLLDRKPATLSGGERQRVAIARALAARPDVLVCDEAVSALDTVTQAGVLELLRGLSHDTAIVFVSHDLGALASIADRLIVIDEGRIVNEGAAAALLTDEHGSIDGRDDSASPPLTANP